MTTLHKAAQQALEALESSRVFVTTREKTKHPEGTEWYDERITALRAALAEPPDSTKPVMERNFCPRCGKRANDIHTCTPPLTEQGCDHCRHVLYAATKCKNCGRVTE